MKTLDRNNPPEWAVGCFDKDVGFLAMEFFDTKEQAIENWEWRNAVQKKTPWLPSQTWAVRCMPNDASEPRR